MVQTKFNLLGQRVADAISAAGVTRREIAARLELPADALYRRLWGTVPWRVKELEVIAENCGTTVGALLGEDR